jgi:creatinine amidohydrolase
MSGFTPDFGNRSLLSMSLPEIRAIEDKANAPVIVTTAAIEQHGRHLPVGVDSMLADAWLHQVNQHLPNSVECYFSPPIYYGKSNEHADYPGTLSINKSLLIRLLKMQFQQLESWGFNHILVLNTHGGNIQVIRSTIREFMRSSELTIGILQWDCGMDVSETEATFGFHAGEIETSWMLAIEPELVDKSLSDAAFPDEAFGGTRLKPEAAAAIYSWITSDISPSGVIGDPSQADAARGERWLNQGGKHLADIISRYVANISKANIR